MVVKIKQSENDFQNTIIELAQRLGWKVAHFRGVRIQRRDGTVYYQTPVQADGAGWPDLVLVHPSGRIIFAEVKSETGRLSKEQEMWLSLLAITQEEVHVWRPSDWDNIVALLSQ